MGRTPDVEGRSRSYRGAMLLYTCKLESKHPAWHPCGTAARALDEAGYKYEIATVRGYKNLPWTWRTRERDREVIRKLSGQSDVPLLVTDGGEVVAGTAAIKQWAAANPAPPAREPALSA